MRFAPPALAAVAAVLLACAAPAHAGGPSLVLGVNETAVKRQSLSEARARMAIVRLIGFDTVRINTTWWPGETEPDAAEVQEFRNVVAAAQLNGIRVVVAVYNHGNRTTPLSEEYRTEFAEYAAWIVRTFPYIREVIVGNEPNLNRFWMPQFTEDGGNAAAPAYLELLAQTYDRLKAVSPSVTVIGGALAPRGTDRPGTNRDTHSPVKFLRDLGAAYRTSGRTRPIMDQLSIHPYGDSSSQPPNRSRHPGTTVGLADYAKLVRVLGEAFDGTRQRGSTLPIVYGEFGVETRIPRARQHLYSGAEPARTRPVDEQTQGRFYRQAIGLAFCQPTVRALMLFHVWDEPLLPGWQSGVYYVDGRPKASLPAVRQALAESRRGVVRRCPGLALTPAVERLVWPRGRITGRAPLRLGLRCSIDCAYTAHLVRVGQRTPVAVARGQAVGKVLTSVVLRRPQGQPRTNAGRYVVRLFLAAPVNRGRTVVRTSPPLNLG
ncbi:MAG: cellulase family glycosylhydrolase [Thermoleophilia bacterium]|nr:cellulase family glycosylhydrolase [Thermoleophilia bacterium]